MELWKIKIYVCYDPLLTNEEERYIQSIWENPTDVTGAYFGRALESLKLSSVIIGIGSSLHLQMDLIQIKLCSFSAEQLPQPYVCHEWERAGIRGFSEP